MQQPTGWIVTIIGLLLLCAPRSAAAQTKCKKTRAKSCLDLRTEWPYQEPKLLDDVDALTPPKWRLGIFLRDRGGSGLALGSGDWKPTSILKLMDADDRIQDVIESRSLSPDEASALCNMKVCTRSRISSPTEHAPGGVSIWFSDPEQTARFAIPEITQPTQVPKRLCEVAEKRLIASVHSGTRWAAALNFAVRPHGTDWVEVFVLIAQSTSEETHNGEGSSTGIILRGDGHVVGVVPGLTRVLAVFDVNRDGIAEIVAERELFKHGERGFVELWFDGWQLFTWQRFLGAQRAC